MRLRWASLAIPVALLSAAGLAQAATVKYPDGTTKKLAKGDSVTAAAQGATTITADNEKDTLTLRKGAVVRYEGTDADDKGTKVESFFLVKGGLDANVGHTSRLATPGFWAFPEKAGARATFYAESFGVGTGYVRNAKGSGLVRLLVTNTEIHVHADQGVTVERAANGTLGFTTDTNNAWRPHTVNVLYPLPTGIQVELNVPKATAGSIGPKPNAPGKTLVQNQISSWKSGAIAVATFRDDTMIKSGRLAPGVPCTIDNQTGGIEFGGVTTVEFATLKAAVSLTSEFESLATSPITKPKN